MNASAPASGKPAPEISADPGKVRFWVVIRRTIQIAAAIDLLFFILFHVLGPPILAWVNLVSLSMYGAAYILLLRRKNRLAVALIWLEVLGHASLGTLVLGWDSGFHFYLLMFIPAIFVSARVRTASLIVVLLWVFYLSLDMLSRSMAPLQPINDIALTAVRYFNISCVFAMFSYLAYFYVNTVLAAQKRLDRLATTDSLTGLFNRRHIIGLLQHELTRRARSGEPLSLLMADIDHFKEINDVHGHDAGDIVLTAVSDVVRRTVRAQDVVARWGGEEFLVLLPGTESSIAALIAERIRAAVAATSCNIDGKPVAISLTLGLAGHRDGDRISEVISRADQAMYRGKAQGRNRVVTETDA